MKASEVVAAIQYLIQHHGDREVFFTDGFSDFGVQVQQEGAANYNSPRAFLVKAFSLDTGKNVPDAPMQVAPASCPHFRVA